MRTTAKQLKALPLFSPALKIVGPSRITESGWGKPTLSFGDECGNGHNTFSITASGRWFSGCCHDLIRETWPEYSNIIKWHLTSIDGPLHYIANTLYHAKGIPKFQGEWYFYLESKPIKIVNQEEKTAMIVKYGDNAEFKDYENDLAIEPNLEYARNTAIAPNAALCQLSDAKWLTRRLPRLLSRFAEDMGKTFGDQFPTN